MIASVIPSFISLDDIPDIHRKVKKVKKKKTFGFPKVAGTSALKLGEATRSFNQPSDFWSSKQVHKS